MARPKKAVAVEADEQDFEGQRVSVREIQIAQEEARGVSGNPPKELDERSGKLLPMRSDKHAFRRADFSGANLEGMDLQSMDLRSIVFKNCNLKGVNFTNANLQGCNFQGADLTDAILDGADVRWAIAPNGNSFPVEAE